MGPWRYVRQTPKKTKASTQKMARREAAKKKKGYTLKGYTLNNVFQALPLALRLGDFALGY